MTTADESSTDNAYYIIKFPTIDNDYKIVVYQCIVKGHNNAKAFLNCNNKIYAIQIKRDKIIYEIGKKPAPFYETSEYEEWYIFCNTDVICFLEIEVEDLDCAKLILEISNF